MKVAEITILDGGIGHLFKSKGVEQLCEGLAYDELFAAGSLANVLRPELVREVHEQYVQAGADVIEANNFSCTRWSLDKIGRADHALELAVAGAKIAREVATASGRRVSVAGKAFWWWRCQTSQLIVVPFLYRFFTTSGRELPGLQPFRVPSHGARIHSDGNSTGASC